MQNWVDVFDPADLREPVARVPALTAEEVRRVYDRAELGYTVWRTASPFGGFRDSGSPFKEQGGEALRFYTRVKTFAIHHG